MGSGCCFGNGKHCNFLFSEEVCMLKKKRKDMGWGRGAHPVQFTRSLRH